MYHKYFIFYKKNILLLHCTQLYMGNTPKCIYSHSQSSTYKVPIQLIHADFQKYAHKSILKVFSQCKIVCCTSLAL